MYLLIIPEISRYCKKKVLEINLKLKTYESITL